jgi:hypothetical protein
MGTMRLVVESCDRGIPAEVSVERLGQLLPDRRNQLWLDISDPGRRRSRSWIERSASTSCAGGCHPAPRAAPV